MGLPASAKCSGPRRQQNPGAKSREAEADLILALFLDILAEYTLAVAKM